MQTWSHALKSLPLSELLPGPGGGLKPPTTARSAVAAPLAGIAERPAVASSHGAIPPHERKELSRRRGEAMRAMFPKMFSWFASRWDLHGMREVDAYLSQSKNVFDLEERIRYLERRRHFSG